MNTSRRIATQILYQTEIGDQTLDRCLEIAAEGIAALNRADRSLLHALVYGVLRWRKRLDWIIDQWARRPKKIELKVRIALRIGLYQLLFMDRIPKPAAVHSTVELVKSEGFMWAAGFVNGLLRKAASEAQPPLPSQKSDPVQRIALEHSMPCWLVTRWLNRFDVMETDALCRVINTIPSITLRANTLRASREELFKCITKEVHDPQNTEISPDGIHFSTPLQPIVTWPAFVEGWFQVQDEAAQLISYLLDPHPGESVWDMCAGLGTKTAHVAQLMGNQGAILATDIAENKLQALNKEMRRLGITLVVSQTTDGSSDPTVAGGRQFDRILVDAPCTGMGVLQKNPDAKWRRKPDDFERYCKRQLALLRSASIHLKPGGRLVYSVCSFEPEETSAVVDKFLVECVDFTIDTSAVPILEGVRPPILSNGYLTTYPHRHGMDGFFAVMLRRR